MKQLEDEHQNNELFEKLASIEHNRWADWQKYLHSKCIESSIEGYVSFPVKLFKRWERQINTNYCDLSETEKESDRKQVLRYFHLIKGYCEESSKKEMNQLEESILMYSFRYALNRNIYAVSDVVEAILEKKDKLSDYFKEKVLEEIEKSDLMYQEPYSIQWNRLIKELAT